jgi:hypothetical protein
MALLDNITYSPGEPIQNMYDKINAAIDKINDVLGGGTADQIVKKVDGTDFNTLMVNSFLPASGTGNLKIAKVPIGDWNMNTTTSITVAHGISDYKKIVAVFGRIRDDADSVYTSLTGSFTTGGSPDIYGSITSWDETNINAARPTSSIYNDPNYNATSYNRGDLFIIYEG